jgi:Flp pilus assembly protein TadB
MNGELKDYSKEYDQFKKETLKSLNWYEKACKNIGKSFTVKMKPAEEAQAKRYLEIAHLEVTPQEAAGFAWFVLLVAFFLSVLISGVVYLLVGSFSNEILVVFFLLLAVSFFLYYYVNTLPKRNAQRWRLKSSSQMVPAILYVVVYMRHTSNLEGAIRFASEHLQPPLALDFKKIFWDVETSKYSTIKDALDAYLESWRVEAPEFTESFHMIEASLYEPSEERRMATLEKSLQIILDGVYEKMLHFSHDVQAPITNVYMLGIVLPTLALALLPLASTLLQGAIQWYHVAILFDIVVPFFIFYMTSNVLAKRPGGFGETELLEKNKNYKIYADKSHYTKAFLMALPFFILGILPFIFYFGSGFLGVPKDFTFQELGLGFLGNQQVFDFKMDDKGRVVGPFGTTALVLSLFVPLSIAIFFIMAYKLKTEKLIKTREETKKLEDEFSSSIFQLGNRLADGVPAEMVFGRVAESSKGSASAGFFSMVNSNIQQAGMSVEEAVFNSARGAINYYPSDLLRTSMQIMVEAVKKGLSIAAKAMMSISTYVKNIHTVNERLKDLLAEITSSMKSNMTFLAPLLSAIIVGLASMITSILGKLKLMLETGAMQSGSSIGGLGSVSTIVEMFDINKMIPPYWLQVAVGIYIVEVIFILTMTLITIESGEDRLGEKYEISKNLQTGMTLYFITALVAIIALAALAGVAISGIGS